MNDLELKNISTLEQLDNFVFENENIYDINIMYKPLKKLNMLSELSNIRIMLYDRNIRRFHSFTFVDNKKRFYMSDVTNGFDTLLNSYSNYKINYDKLY